MRPYRAFYNGRTFDLTADSSYNAQLLAAKHFRVKKAWNVAVVLMDVALDTGSL